MNNCQECGMPTVYEVFCSPCQIEHTKADRAEGRTELERLRKAVTAMVVWFDAEKADTGTFWDKADLCKYAEWTARKALGQDVGEFEGIPRLFLVHTNKAGEIPTEPVSDPQGRS